MLRYGAKCGFDPSWAEPALSYAAITGSTFALSAFVSEFDINHRINGNETALMLASRHGRFDTVLTLIANGADIAMQNQSGLDSIQIAEGSRHQTIAALLELYASESWNEIASLVLLIQELLFDSPSSQLESYETLLTTPKFRQLLELRLDCDLESGEIMRFRATDRCSIGFDRSGYLIWMLDGLRASYNQPAA